MINLLLNTLNHNVFRFHVKMHNIFRVEFQECWYHLDYKGSNLSIPKLLFLHELPQRVLIQRHDYPKTAHVMIVKILSYFDNIIIFYPLGISNFFLDVLSKQQLMFGLLDDLYCNLLIIIRYWLRKIDLAKCSLS